MKRSLQWHWGDEEWLGSLPNDPDNVLAIVKKAAAGRWSLGCAFASFLDAEPIYESEELAHQAADQLINDWIYINTLGWRPTAATAPKIVCLCGSTRFMEAFQAANLKETLAGHIVLSVGCNTKSDADIFKFYEYEDMIGLKGALDELHKRKIDLCDEVLVLNVGGYIGESTRSEIEYAMTVANKPVRYLEATKGAES